MVNLVLPRRSHDSQSDGIFLQKFCRTAAEPACASTSKPNTSWHGVIPASIPTDRDSHNPMPDLLGAHSGSPTPLCHSAEVAPSSLSAPATHRFHWKSATMPFRAGRPSVDGVEREVCMVLRGMPAEQAWLKCGKPTTPGNIQHRAVAHHHQPRHTGLGSHSCGLFCGEHL